MQGQLQQAVHQLGVAQALVLHQFRVHADGGKARQGVQLVAKHTAGAALLFLNTRTAAELVLLKALFALLTRGLTAGFLSLCGGVLSFLVLWGLLHLPASPGEFIFTVSGALAHNIGQLLGASVLLSSAMALGYAPVLLVAGLCVGALSCVLSKALFAAMPKNAPGRVNQYKLFKK